MRRRKLFPLIPILMNGAVILLLIGLFHLFTPSSP
ncbi:hypothetical protein QFZ72_000631 [Bacillus sp. V2I10]|nr:hypothetical protein [Bacillus sp. V2I10]